eukprot:Amastigsp_a180152_6.p3 type:complete len:203 gc:universal Amastigsp_a180152_6:1909-1301(-)
MGVARQAAQRSGVVPRPGVRRQARRLRGAMGLVRHEPNVRPRVSPVVGADARAAQRAHRGRGRSHRGRSRGSLLPAARGAQRRAVRAAERVARALCGATPRRADVRALQARRSHYDAVLVHPAVPMAPAVRRGRLVHARPRRRKRPKFYRSRVGHIRRARDRRRPRAQRNARLQLQNRRAAQLATPRRLHRGVNIARARAHM